MQRWWQCYVPPRSIVEKIVFVSSHASASDLQVHGTLSFKSVVLESQRQTTKTAQAQRTQMKKSKIDEAMTRAAIAYAAANKTPRFQLDWDQAIEWACS